jgi:hypothetical protein
MARSTGRRSARGAAPPSDARQQQQRQEGRQEEEKKEEDEYEVEAVVGRRRRGGATEYLVQWKGYSEQTWEPARNLCCPELIRAFEQHQASESAVDDDVSLSAVSLDDQQSESGRADRFVLVADEWGPEPSAVLFLQHKPREDSTQVPVLLHRVGVDAQSKSVELHVCDVEAVGGWSLPSAARLVAARAVLDEELAVYVVAEAAYTIPKHLTSRVVSRW